MTIFTLSRFNVSTITLGFVSLFSLVGSANAAIMNGNFNNGLNNWDVSGDVAVFESRGLLTTASSTTNDDLPTTPLPSITDDSAPVLELSPITLNVSGNDVTGIANLETFLGVDPFALDPTDSFFGAFEGSAIKQTFTAKSGDSLDFNWNFLTNEDSSAAFFANDTAFITLVNTSDNTAQVTTLADLNSTLNDSGNSLDFIKETGTNNFSQTLTPGEYTLGFTVVDDIDSTISSALSVDNVRLSNDANPDPTTTPEPGTILAFLSTMLLGTKATVNKK